MFCFELIGESVSSSVSPKGLGPDSFKRELNCKRFHPAFVSPGEATHRQIQSFSVQSEKEGNLLPPLTRGGRGGIKEERVYLSSAEKERRYRLLRERMKREGLNAILLVGNSGIGGTSGPGSFRYLTDFYMIFDYGLLLFFAESDPVMWVGSDLTQYHAGKYSWIKDVRVNSRSAQEVVKVVKQREKAKGKLGIVSLYSLPAAVFQSLRDELPSWELIDANPILLDLRFSKSEEEQVLLRKAAEIADGSFQEVLKMIGPGVKGREIIGCLEGFHRRQGSDRTFNIIGSGPFPREDKNDSPINLWSYAEWEVQKGDVVVFEITTVYGGYWNQLNRAVSVGRQNPELSLSCDACLKTLQAGVKAMRPGVRTSEFVATMDRCARDMGYELKTPVGHYVGLDLVEARVNPDIDLILQPGASAIVHPILSKTQGDNLFLGQTYLVTENETVSLNSTGNELVVVS